MHHAAEPVNPEAETADRNYIPVRLIHQPTTPLRAAYSEDASTFACFYVKLLKSEVSSEVSERGNRCLVVISKSPAAHLSRL